MIIQKAITLAMNIFEQKMRDFAENANSKELTAELAAAFSKKLKEGLSAAGREAYRHFIESYDVQDSTLELQGRIFRWKMISPKKFLTPYGIIEIKRSLYQPDTGGKSYCPLDHFWGMQGEFAIEEVREAIAYSMAHLTARETEQFFKKCSWFQPSITAIKNITKHLGVFVETHAARIQHAVQSSGELPAKTDIVVASMDGANVLLREPGVQQGRPAQRPRAQGNSKHTTAYKNAMVGVVSCYAFPADQEERPDRLQSRYIAYMPQERATTFKQQFEREIIATEAKARQDVTKLFLCDGHRAIWSYADNNPLYDDYEKLLDFYHTSEHLSQASEALFGKSSTTAKAWYHKYRKKLLEEPNGADSVLRSLAYYSKRFRLSKSHREDLKKEKTFFRRNKHLMKYADFLMRGLPIGSGPVEAACKSIIKTRLCRSGMRWTRKGGQHILYLRCFVKSNRWDDFWKQYLQLKKVS